MSNVVYLQGVDISPVLSQSNNDELLSKMCSKLFSVVPEDGYLDLDLLFRPCKDITTSIVGERMLLPVHLEIGSGKGEWVVEQSKDSVSSDGTVLTNWLAIELRCDRVQEAVMHQLFSDHRLLSSLPNNANLSFLAGDAYRIVQHYMPTHSIAAVFINHPEPPARKDGDKR